MPSQFNVFNNTAGINSGFRRASHVAPIPVRTLDLTGSGSMAQAADAAVDNRRAFMRLKQVAKLATLFAVLIAKYRLRPYRIANGAAKAACMMIGYLILLSSAPIFGQEINVLLIHGRLKNPHESYGWHRSDVDPKTGKDRGDQANAWDGLKPISTGHVWYVQWDAWNKRFDSTAWPGGGEAVIHRAVDALCDATKGQACWILCHSAGCAAFENYLAKSDYAHNSILIMHVMAANSAAGGSELADDDLMRLLVRGWGSGRIDDSLKTAYARSEYNHNNMQAVVVRGVGGATVNYPLKPLLVCGPFPRQRTGRPNPNCNTCFGVFSECSDGAVALHSSCGHNRKASFQDCNSRIPPHNDVAGTYNYHGWWINDNWGGRWNGPYSNDAQALWNSAFKTYNVDHSGGKKLLIQEYSAAPHALCP